MLKNKLLILFILIIASFLRLWKLNELPRDVHVDEIMNAYVGNFVIRNGVDLYGNHWPILYFDNFGDYPNILPMYLSGISVSLFGNSEFAIRLPIALLGITSVALVYLIAKIIFRKEFPALFSALSLAIFPWHIVLSRATAEGISAATIFLLGLYLLLKYLESQKIITFILALIFLLSTYLLYASYRVIIPLIILPTFLLTKDKTSRILCLFAFLLGLTLTLIISQTTWGTGRFEQTSLFSQQSSVYPMQAEFITGEGTNNALKARLLYNKIIMFGKEFSKQYMSYFSFEFLFAKGGLPMRYFVPDQGLWYYSYFLLYLILISTALLKSNYFVKNSNLALATKKQKKYFFYIFYILLLSPLPAALTIDDAPNIHRAALMPLILSITSGLIVFFVQELSSKYKLIIFSFFVILLSFESFYFFNKYNLHSGKFEQVYRSPAMKNMAKYLNEQKNKFDNIYVEKKGETAIYYLYYNQIFNKELSTQFHKKLQIAQIDNIHFTEHECVHPGLINDDLKQKNSLFIMSASCFKDKLEILKNYPELKELDQIKSSQGDVIFISYSLEASQSSQISN